MSALCRIAPRVIPPFICSLFLLSPMGLRGILLHDEGHFLLVANTIAEGVGLLARGEGLAAIRDAIHSGGGALYFTAKPGHILLLAFAGLTMVAAGLRIRKLEIAYAD